MGITEKDVLKTVLKVPQLEEQLENIVKNSFNKTKITSHRGLIALAPENTVKSVKLACEHGYNVVEIDPRRTRDGVWILMHDETVDRTTNGTGTVSNMLYSEINNLKIDTPSALVSDETIKVPTLDEVLKICSIYNVGVNLDGGKVSWTSEYIKEIYELLVKHNLVNNSWIMITDTVQRDLVAKLYPQLRVGWLSSNTDCVTDINESKKYNRALVGYMLTIVNSNMIEACKSNNLPVLVYQVNQDHSYNEMKNLCVDYVETDYILPKGE